jgi:hypothetical protein
VNRDSSYDDKHVHDKMRDILASYKSEFAYAIRRRLDNIYPLRWKD